jgi:hypothetical protein
LARGARVLLGPGAAQGLHRRELRQLGLIARRIDGGQEPFHPGQLLAGHVGLGHVVGLDAPAVPPVPLRRGQRPEPVGRHHGQFVQGGPQRLADPLEPVEDAHRGQDMGRVGALPAPRSDQSEIPASVQEGVQELLSGLAVDQSGAELAQDGVIEAGIGQFQAEGVLPVDAAADGVGGLAVGEALDVSENRGQRQPCGRGGGLAAGGEEVGELIVVVERSAFLGDAETESPRSSAMRRQRVRLGKAA